RLQVNGARLRVGARAWAASDGLPLQAVLDLDRHRGDGRAWLGGTPVDLASWAPLLRFAGVQVAGGRGRLATWVDLRDFRPVMVTTDSELTDVELKGSATAHVAEPALQLQRLQARARWRYSR